MSVMTTGGAVLLAFYKDNNDLIIWAWNLMGFPSVMYIILNINEQAPRFPSISGLTIGNVTDITLSISSLELPWLTAMIAVQSPSASRHFDFSTLDYLSASLPDFVSLKRAYQRSL